MSQYAVDLAVLPGRQRTPSVTGVSSLRQRHSGVAEGLTSPPLIGPNGTIVVSQPEISHEGEDLVYEVLAINTLAMQRCKTEEWARAMTMLNEAYAKLNADGVDRVIEAPQLLDQLRGTTLNNMGVVECHRAKPRQALSHFESARQMEENWNMSSPSVALNTCAAYNALGMYDKATAAALETIEMLRTLELQRTRAKKLAAAAPPAGATATATCSRSIAFTPMNSATHEQKEEEDDMLKAATSPQIADSDNRALWGAAWHNLAVAQLNTSRDAPRREISEYTNALTVFQNAMRATQEQLGCQHPLTKAVTDTYRDVRRALHQRGAFRQHHTLMTVPPLPVDPREQEYADMLVVPLPGKTIRGTIERKRHDLTITFRGEATGGAKLVERIDRLPYPGAKDEVYQSKRTNHSGDLAKTPKRSRKALSRLPLSRALSRAAQVYSNPHPLLYTQPPAAEKPAAMTGHSDFGGTVPTWGSHHALPPQSVSEFHPTRSFGSTSSSPAAVCRPPQDPMPLSGRQRPGGTTRPRPSPPPRTRGHRRGPSSADPQTGGRPPHGVKKTLLPAISPPHHGSSVGSWQHGGDAPAGGGYRPVHQQDPQSMPPPPPPPPAQQQWRYQPPAPYAYPPSGELMGYHGTAPVNTHFDQSKLLLLAQPPLVAPSTRTTYFPVELPEPESVPQPRADRESLDYVGPRVAERGVKEAPTQKRGSHAGEGPTLSYAHPFKKMQEHRRRSSCSWSQAKGHPSVNTRPTALQETTSGTNGPSEEQPPPPRELFNAMWVTADRDYVQYSRDVRGLARNATAGGTGSPVPIAMPIEEDGLPTHRYGPAPSPDGEEESPLKGSGVGVANTSMAGSVGSPLFLYTSSTSTEDAADSTDVLAGTSAPLS